MLGEHSGTLFLFLASVAAGQTSILAQYDEKEGKKGITLTGKEQITKEVFHFTAAAIHTSICLRAHVFWTRI